MIRRGELWWADFGAVMGSTAAYRRPVLVVSADHLNASDLRTVVVVPVTSSTDRQHPKNNLPLPAARTGLPRDSFLVPTSIQAIDKNMLESRIGALPTDLLTEVEQILLSVLGMIG